MDVLRKKIDDIDKLYAEYHENAYKCNKYSNRCARKLSIKIRKELKEYRRLSIIYDKA